MDGTFYWLLASWSFFGVSLLSTLISFLVSQSACDKQITILEEEYFNDKKDKKLEIKKNKAANWTFGLNIASITAFIFGVVFLVVFVSVNVPHNKERFMPEEKKETKKNKVQIQEGFYPQNIPLAKGATVVKDEKEKIDEGSAPKQPPSRPLDKEDKGFVPQPPPKKPPEKPDNEKK